MHLGHTIMQEAEDYLRRGECDDVLGHWNSLDEYH